MVIKFQRLQESGAWIVFVIFMRGMNSSWIKFVPCGACVQRDGFNYSTCLESTSRHRDVMTLSFLWDVIWWNVNKLSSGGRASLLLSFTPTREIRFSLHGRWICCYRRNRDSNFNWIKRLGLVSPTRIFSMGR